MAEKILLRRDTAAEWQAVNPILADGEIGVVADSHPPMMKIGNGSTAWNDLAFINNMPYEAYRSYIVAIGDSETAGYPYTDPGPADASDTSSWTYYVRAGLGVKIHNKGIGGQTSAEILARFDTDVVANNPTHAIIMCGINDAYHTEKAVALEQTKLNIQAMLAKCHQNNIVPIMGLYPPTDLCNYPIANLATINTQVDQTRSWIASYCQANGILCIDFYSQFRENNTNTVIASYMYTDGLHPNTSGYKVMGLTAINFLKDMLPEFIGVKSPTEKFITQYTSGTSPRIPYVAGQIVVEGAPQIGSPAFWVCTASGTPGTWGATGYVRNTHAMAPNRCYYVATNDLTDYFWEKGDHLWYQLDTNTLVLYEVTAAGYSNSHSVPSERATFTIRATIPLNASSGPGIYIDYLASPNLTRYYPAGSIVVYPDSSSGNGCAFIAVTAGYNVNSTSTPHAAWKQIATM